MVIVKGNGVFLFCSPFKLELRKLAEPTRTCGCVCAPVQGRGEGSAGSAHSRTQHCLASVLFQEAVIPHLI